MAGYDLHKILAVMRFTKDVAAAFFDEIFYHEHVAGAGGMNRLCSWLPNARGGAIRGTTPDQRIRDDSLRTL
jgi:hypothetical protein